MFTIIDISYISFLLVLVQTSWDSWEICVSISNRNDHVYILSVCPVQ